MTFSFITCARPLLLLFSHFLALFVLLPITEVECGQRPPSFFDDGSGSLTEKDLRAQRQNCVDDHMCDNIRATAVAMERAGSFRGLIPGYNPARLLEQVDQRLTEGIREFDHVMQTGMLQLNTSRINAPSGLDQVEGTARSAADGMATVLSGGAGPSTDAGGNSHHRSSPNSTPKGRNYNPGASPFSVAPDQETVENISSSGGFTPEFKALPSLTYMEPQGPAEIIRELVYELKEKIDLFLDQHIERVESSTDKWLSSFRK